MGIFLLAATEVYFENKKVCLDYVLIFHLRG